MAALQSCCFCLFNPLIKLSICTVDLISCGLFVCVGGGDLVIPEHINILYIFTFRPEVVVTASIQNELNMYTQYPIMTN